MTEITVLKKGSEINAFSDSADGYNEVGGGFSGSTGDSSYDLSDGTLPFSVYDGILGADGLKPYIGGTGEMRIRKGMVHVYGRQAIWNDTECVATAEQFGFGGKVYIYLGCDLTSPSEQKMVLFASRDSTLSKGDNLGKLGYGYARFIIAVFGIGEDLKLNVVQDLLAPRKVSDTATETHNAKAIQGVSSSDIANGTSLKWADSSAVANECGTMIGEKFLIVGERQKLFKADAIGWTTDSTAIIPDTETSSSIYNGVYSNSFDTDRLVGFRISLEGNGSDYLKLEVKDYLWSNYSKPSTREEYCLRDFQRDVFIGSNTSGILSDVFITGRKKVSSTLYAYPHICDNRQLKTGNITKVGEYGQGERETLSLRIPSYNIVSTWSHNPSMLPTYEYDSNFFLFRTSTSSWIIDNGKLSLPNLIRWAYYGESRPQGTPYTSHLYLRAVSMVYNKNISKYEEKPFDSSLYFYARPIYRR